jgi:lysophospholipid acyltransferase (LPLAT)-like uncharacterized protein
MQKSFKKKFRRLLNIVSGWAIIQWPVACVYCILIWFVYFTSYKDIEGYNILKKFSKKPAIFVFWHGRTMMLSPLISMAGVRGYAIADPRKDGRAIAKLERLFGLKAIFGSSFGGGVSVLRKGVKVLLQNKGCLALSPDGPKGPSMRFHDGALYFAKMTGAPIIPVCVSCSRPWFQNRWDRYLLTKPFSIIHGSVEKPVFVDAKTDIKDFEKLRKKLEDLMVNQAYDLDKHFTDFKVEQDLTPNNFAEKAKII